MLQQENEVLKENLGRPGALGRRGDTENDLTRDEEEEEDEEEGSEGEDDELENFPVLPGKRGPPCFSLSNESGKRHCMRPRNLDLTSHQTETVTHL